MRKDELQFEHTGSPSITREESWNKESYPSVLKGYSLSTRQELLARERVKRKDEKRNDKRDPQYYVRIYSCQKKRSQEQIVWIYSSW